MIEPRVHATTDHPVVSGLLDRSGGDTPSRAEVAVAGHRGDVRTARLGLQSTDPKVRAGALTALARAGVLDAAAIGAGLADTDVSVIRRAVELIATIPLDTASSHMSTIDATLLGLLRGPNDTLAEVAAFALGERHQEANGSAALDSIVVALSDVATGHHDPIVREAAVAALGSVGDPGGLTAVLRATSDKATVRRRAVLALAAFEGDAVDAALATARTDRDWQVRQAAEDLTDPRV